MTLAAFKLESFSAAVAAQGAALTFSREALDQAFADGLAEGMARQQDEQARTLNAGLERLARALTDEDARRAELRCEAVAALAPILSQILDCLVPAADSRRLEAALTEEDAKRYLASYEQAIHAIGKASHGRGIYEGPGISIKLSALHPRYSRAQYERVMDELYPTLLGLTQLAKQYDIGLNIDAEEADRLELSLDIIEELVADDTLFANGDEAAYLSHVPIRAPLDVCEAGYRLMCNGVGSVVITRGQEGAFVASPFDYDFFLPPPVDVHEVTGAGDALVAGVIFGRIGGHSMEDAMRIGLACAAWAVETAETVNPSLNADLAIERAGLLRKSA